MALASVTALVATMGLNAYSGMLTVVTALNSMSELKPTPRLRIIAILSVSACWITATFAITTDAIALLFATLTIMLYLLVPWTSVNLVDYFFVRRGRYAITHLFMPQGIYGAWGTRGLAAYLIGFVATMPFFVLPDVYTGPAARALGGVDVGWLVGLAVSGGAYFLLSRSLNLSAESGAIQESEQTLRRAFAP
jgi:NCS1 family nucleobase:cation symporter-1